MISLRFGAHGSLDACEINRMSGLWVAEVRWQLIRGKTHINLTSLYREILFKDKKLLTYVEIATKDLLLNH